MTKAEHHLTGIQILRGFAAVLVAVGHATIEVPAITGYQGLLLAHSFNYGFGVDIFFVISGFIMIRSTRDDFGMSAGQARFAISRIARIVPLYWVLTALTIASAIIAPTLVRGGSRTLVLLLRRYFFCLPLTRVAMFCRYWLSGGH